MCCIAAVVLEGTSFRRVGSDPKVLLAVNGFSFGEHVSHEETSKHRYESQCVAGFVLCVQRSVR